MSWKPLSVLQRVMSNRRVLTLCQDELPQWYSRIKLPREREDLRAPSALDSPVTFTRVEEMASIQDDDGQIAERL